ncbi:hypothetical protein [Anaerotignum sp.]
MKKLLIFVGVIVAFCLYCIISNEMELKKMATVEGRQEVIREKYEGAVITSEKELEGYIISAFDVGGTPGHSVLEEHGYAVFEPIAEGKYDFKTYSIVVEKYRLAHGDIRIPESETDYDIYVCKKEGIEYLDVTRRDTYTGELLQHEKLYLDDSGIAILKQDPVVWAWQTNITGYDAEGNPDDLW